MATECAADDDARLAVMMLDIDRIEQEQAKKLASHAVYVDGTPVALLEHVKARPIDSVKILDLVLNPAANPDYYVHDDEIPYYELAQTVMQILAAAVIDGAESGLNIVKMFGRGEEMKTIFRIVADITRSNPVDGLDIRYAKGWLFVELKR